MALKSFAHSSALSSPSPALLSLFNMSNTNSDSVKLKITVIWKEGLIILCVCVWAQLIVMQIKNFPFIEIAWALLTPMAAPAKWVYARFT